MKIVHCEDFIHPDTGYQLNLLSKLQVEQGHEVTIVTSELKKMPEFLTSFFGKDNIEERDRAFTERTGVKIIRVPIYTFISGRSIYPSKIFKIVDEQNPDCLFVHGEDTMLGIQFIWKASKLKYPMVLDCHMLEMASKNRFRKVFRWVYKNFVTPKIIKNNIPLIRVVDSDYVQKCLGLPLEKTILLSFGTDTKMFCPNKEKGNAWRKAHGLKEDDFVVLYAGKLDEHKGGQFFAEMLVEKFPQVKGRDVKFIVVGNAVGEYGKKVEETLKQTKNDILRFPTQTYVGLLDFYQAADVALFPKQCSLSFFEVQSCGLPVIFEENEINDLRVQYGNGLTFKPGNIEDFRNKIIEAGNMDDAAFEKMRQNGIKYVKDEYDYVPIAQQFTDVCVKAVEDWKAKKKK